MSALERVARRIGMVPSDVDGYWLDPPSREAYTGTAELRTYLLTGDRPLRILASLRKTGAYAIASLEFRVTNSVLIRYWPRDAEGPILVYGQDEANAIIALAEKIEGEGRD